MALLGWPIWIGVVVDDLERQRRFYREVLGLPEMDVGTDWVQFELGQSHVFELVQRSELPQYDRPRYQVGYAVADIDAARTHLLAEGARPIGTIEGDARAGGRWCYFHDAEGNVFELKERPEAGP